MQVIPNASNPFPTNVYFSLSFDFHSSEYYWMQDGSGSHMQFPSHGPTSKASYQALFPISSWQPVSWERNVVIEKGGANLRCLQHLTVITTSSVVFLYPEIILRKCKCWQGTPSWFNSSEHCGLDISVLCIVLMNHPQSCSYKNSLFIYIYVCFAGIVI